MTKKGTALVAVQIIAIVILAIVGNPFNYSWIVLVQALGLFVGAWAITTMRFHFRIFPEVGASQKLVTTGPYQFIRHPMYLALLLITLAWVLALPTVLGTILWLLLVADLVLKLQYEEEQLAKRFPTYPHYQLTTKKLIPFVY